MNLLDSFTPTKKTIMIVDDDATSLAIASALLESEYQVVTAKSGLQALGYLKENQAPDLILLDMMMPGTSGMEVLKSLKSVQELSKIPVIFLTSLDTVDFELEGFIHGADDFMQKPIHADLLRMKIKRQLYIFQLKQENMILQERLQTLRSRIDQVFDDIM